MRPQLKRRERIDFLTEALFAGPATLMVVTFVLLPILIALYLSFTNWDGFTPNPDFVGVKNYTRFFTDPEVGHAAAFTLLIAVVGTAACNALGLGAALLVNRSTRFNAVLRAILFYPYVLGAVIIGFLWSAILGSNGALNSLLQSLGGNKIPFLSDPLWASATVIFVVVWSQFGVNMVLYLAGLQTIPESLLEAARMDGANPWQTFWRVKLPLLASVVTINIVLVLIALLRTYELVLALTDGGPAGRTQTIAFHILSTSFRDSQLGYGAAQSMVLMVAIVAITALITAWRRRAELDVAA